MQQKGWLCCKSSCHGCPALHRRARPLAPRDNHSLAEGLFIFHVSVGGAGRALVASLVCAAWHDVVTYLRSWWRCVAPPLPTTRLHADAYLLFPMQAGGCGCSTHVCCVFALAVVLSRGCVWSFTRVPPVMLGVLRIPQYHFACSRRWWSRCTCGGMHGRAYLSLPVASYVSGREGGGRAHLGYASWSPFRFAGAVAVRISCSLRNVAWHVRYLDPTRRVCMLCMFSFCLCVFMCVVLPLGGVWPPSCVLLSFVGLMFPHCAPSTSSMGSG